MGADSQSEPTRRAKRAGIESRRGCRRRAIVLVLAGLALATGMSGGYGEAVDDHSREVETATPISVPFGSDAAAQVAEMRGTPIRPIFEGIMNPPDGYLVTVNDHPLRLAPGVTIRDHHNRIIAPGRLQEPVRVRFTLDHLGQILRVRIVPES